MKTSKSGGVKPVLLPMYFSSTVWKENVLVSTLTLLILRVVLRSR
ncbi:hypothetical protein ACVIWU_006690 [Bradyrhizobium sp. USDA 4509]